MKKTIFNQSKNQSEPAKQKTCPRCEGFGRLFKDIGNCTLCAGYGVVWLTASGWTLKLYGRTGQEKLY